MVDWQALEGIGGMATAIAVVIALVFGLLQLRQADRHRRQTAMAQMVQNTLAPHVIDALTTLLALPDDAPPERFDERTLKAFYVFNFAMEGVGMLVYERTADLHAMDLQLGGIARAAWRKTRRFVEAERVRANPNMAEWFQWLVERMDEDPAPGKKEGAHVAFRDWRA